MCHVDEDHWLTTESELVEPTSGFSSVEQVWSC